MEFTDVALFKVKDFTWWISIETGMIGISTISIYVNHSKHFTFFMPIGTGDYVAKVHGLGRTYKTIDQSFWTEIYEKFGDDARLVILREHQRLLNIAADVSRELVGL